MSKWTNRAAIQHKFWCYRRRPEYLKLVAASHGRIGQKQCILLKGVLEGKPPLEALLDNCYVDVRDVARAHIAAAELPNASVSNTTLLAFSFLHCLVAPSGKTETNLPCTGWLHNLD